MPDSLSVGVTARRRLRHDLVGLAAHRQGLRPAVGRGPNGDSSFAFVPAALRSLWHYHQQMYSTPRAASRQGHAYASKPLGWLILERARGVLLRQPTRAAGARLVRAGDHRPRQPGDLVGRLPLALLLGRLVAARARDWRAGCRPRRAWRRVGCPGSTPRSPPTGRSSSSTPSCSSPSSSSPSPAPRARCSGPRTPGSAARRGARRRRGLRRGRGPRPGRDVLAGARPRADHPGGLAAA